MEGESLCSGRRFVKVIHCYFPDGCPKLKLPLVVCVFPRRFICGPSRTTVAGMCCCSCRFGEEARGGRTNRGPIVGGSQVKCFFKQSEKDEQQNNVEVVAVRNVYYI